MSATTSRSQQGARRVDRRYQHMLRSMRRLRSSHGGRASMCASPRRVPTVDMERAPNVSKPIPCGGVLGSLPEIAYTCSGKRGPRLKSPHACVYLIVDACMPSTLGPGPLLLLIAHERLEATQARERAHRVDRGTDRGPGTGSAQPAASGPI